MLKRNIFSFFTRKPVSEDINLEKNLGKRPWIKLKPGITTFNLHLVNDLTFEIHSEDRKYLEKIYNKIEFAKPNETVYLKTNDRLVITQIKGNQRQGLSINDLFSFGRQHLVAINFPRDAQNHKRKEYPTDSGLYDRLPPKAQATIKTLPRSKKPTKARPTGNKTVRLKREISFPEDGRNPITSQTGFYNPAEDDGMWEGYFELPPKNAVSGVYETGSVGIKYWDRDNPNLNGEYPWNKK